MTLIVLLFVLAGAAYRDLFGLATRSECMFVLVTIASIMRESLRGRKCFCFLYDVTKKAEINQRKTLGLSCVPIDVLKFLRNVQVPQGRRGGHGPPMVGDALGAHDHLFRGGFAFEHHGHHYDFWLSRL